MLQEFLQINDFYSWSFIPKDVEVKYIIKDNAYVFFNVTLYKPITGKLLLNLYAKNLEKQGDVHYQRNINFCKTLDMLKNITTDVFK